MASRRAPGPESVDAYLARLPPSSRDALQRIRRLIRKTAPDVTESILYGAPAFRHGTMRLSLAAHSKHLSLYGWARARDAFAAELRPFEYGRGTLRFTPERPLPASLVTGLTKALVALDGPSPGRGGRQATPGPKDAGGARGRGRGKPPR